MFPFFLGVFGYFLYGNLQIFQWVSSMIVESQAPFWNFFFILYFYLPQMFSDGILTGVLLSIFWVLSELSSRNEYIALLVHGISSKKVVYPFLFFALGLSVLTLGLNVALKPWFYIQRQVALERFYGLNRGDEKLYFNQFFPVGPERFVLVKKMDLKDGRVEGLMRVFSEASEKEILTVSNARLNESTDPTQGWRINSPIVYRFDGERLLQTRYELTPKETETLLSDLSYIFLMKSKEPDDMTSAELLEMMRQGEAREMENSKGYVYRYEFHSRFARSLGPLVIAILGVPLSLAFNIKNKAWSVIFTFLLIALYTGGQAWLSGMGKAEPWNPWHVSPVFAAWLPDLVFFVFGFVLFLLLDSPVLFRVREKISRWLLFG